MTDLRRRQQAVDTWLQEPYLGAEEQEGVILHLKEQQASMSRQWTAIFAAMAAILGLGFWYLAWHQWVDPWGLKHHAFFYGIAGKRWVAFGESCSGVSLLLSAGALVTGDRKIRISSNSHRGHTLLLVCATLFALVVGLCWSYFLFAAAQYQETSVFQSFHYAWIPCGPFLYALLVRYLLHTFHNTAHDVAALRSSMYNLHSA